MIYFTDPIDEYTMQNLTEFDEFKFSNASKEDMKFGDADEGEKKQFKKTKEHFKPFTKWWKDALLTSYPDSIENVKISNRLSTTPCVVVTSKYGWSANMERIMRAQALSDDSKRSTKGKKTLEINYKHPLVAALKEKYEADGEDETSKNLAVVMFETALIESGFVIDDSKSMASSASLICSRTRWALRKTHRSWMKWSSPMKRKKSPKPKNLRRKKMKNLRRQWKKRKHRR